jgi:predicted MFS family arabinose efflux permease
MGGGQPIGFSFGLVLGGVFADTIGWRWGFHLCAIVNTIVFGIALFGLPKLADRQTQVLYRLRTEIDWVGITLGSTSLALLSYCFAYVFPLSSSTTQLTLNKQIDIRRYRQDP